MRIPEQEAQWQAARINLARILNGQVWKMPILPEKDWEELDDSSKRLWLYRADGILALPEIEVRDRGGKWTEIYVKVLPK